MEGLLLHYTNSCFEYSRIIKRAGMVILFLTIGVLVGVGKDSYAVEAPDAYESNESMADAYPYSQVEDVEPRIAHYGRAYAVGMKHANLDSEEDVDWYYTTLTSGADCLADLRNIGYRNYYIEVYYYDMNGELQSLSSRPEEHPSLMGGRRSI